MCVRVCVSSVYMQQEVDVLLMWVVLNSRITPRSMLKASLICHVGDKRVVNIPMVIANVHLTLRYGVNVWLIHHRARVCPVNTKMFTSFASHVLLLVLNANCARFSQSKQLIISCKLSCKLLR